MIDAPNPSTDWYVRLGSTVIVSSSLGPVVNGTVPRSCISSARSGVVTQTCAAGAAG